MVALEQFPGHTSPMDLSIRAASDHLHPLSKGVRLADLKAD